MTAMIVMDAVGKHYKGVKALDGLTQRIDAGEVFGFIGPNGAGKTTTIRILSTLLAPNRGRAFLGGVDVVRRPHQAKLLLQTVLGLLPLSGSFSALGGGGSGRTCPRARGISFFHEGLAGFGQNLDGRSSIPGAFEIGKLVAQVFGDVEGRRALGDAEGVGDGVGAAPKAVGHFLGRSQIEEGIGSSYGVSVIQGSSIPDGSQDVLEAVPLRYVVVDVSRGHHWNGEAVR